MVNFPAVEWIQQSLVIDPSGFRHLKQTANGFIKNVDTGAGGVLDYSSVDITGSGAISDTLLVYLRISDMGDASGVYGMRVYWHNTSAFGAGTYRFLEQKSLHFIPNLVLNSSANNTPTNVPITTNFSGTIQTPNWPYGQPWLSGILDQDVSMYLYTAIEVGNNCPIGTFGGAGAGTFRMRCLYDFS